MKVGVQEAIQEAGAQVRVQGALQDDGPQVEAQGELYRMMGSGKSIRDST
jgi:hypothetical protein